MSLDTPSFVHNFKPSAIHYGRGCILEIEDALAQRGLKNALIVCGRNVGSNDEIMDLLLRGIGDRLANVFDETTPAKTVETVFSGISQSNEVNADSIVAVGSGSSLDVGTGIAALANADRTFQEVRSEIIETNSLTLPEEDEQILPLMKAPSTMAGADLSVGAGLVASTEDDSVEAISVDNRLMPTAIFYDPDLFELTPIDILTGSAINGFDKGVEAVYSRFANPVTDATAVRGLRYLRFSLPHLRDSTEPEVLERAVLGIILVQHGVSMPNKYKINIVHAFGHALRNQFGIQQGVAHAIIVPHALRLIFNQGGGRPDVLAEGLVTDDENMSDVEEAVIDAVETIRDGLNLPTRLDNLEKTDKSELREVAERVVEDNFLSIGPPSFDPSTREIEETLQDAW